MPSRVKASATCAACRRRAAATLVWPAHGTNFLLSLPKGPVGQADARHGGRFLDRCPQILLLCLAKGGGNLRSARISRP